MKIILIALATTLSLFSCTFESSEQNEELLQQIQDLKAKEASLTTQLRTKDSSISWYSNTLRYLDNNINEIASKKAELLVDSEGMTEEDRLARINANLDEITRLRSQSRRKIIRLEQKLKERGVENEDLRSLVDDLQLRISQQDDEIEQLRTQLADVSIEYTEIFDAYLEKAEELDRMVSEVNTAYYCYGDYKTLKENGVVTKEGGFAGINKVTKLRNDFNKNYFLETNIAIEDKIYIEAKKKISLLTTHDMNSYEIKKEGDGFFTITINDSESFWEASKYLVVITD